MYQLLRRPEGRPWATPDDWLTLANSDSLPSDRPLMLHMRENRSSLDPHERLTVAIFGTCLAAMSILPALKGFWLVPVYCLGTLAILVFALDRHRMSAGSSETLELGDAQIILRRDRQAPIRLAAVHTRFAAEQRRPTELRLFMRSHQQSVEVGTCLSLEERQAIAPLIAAALADIRRS